MRYLKLLFLFILCGIISCTTNARSAVTYKRNVGRFGDDLFSYARAKAISLQYNIPLLYKPIHHGQDLMITNEPHHYKESDEKKFKKIIHIPAGRRIPIRPNADILYVTDFDKGTTNFKNINLLNALKQMIAPSITIQKLSLPENMITIAIHVRTGKGYDTEIFWQRDKLRFPQFEFYVHRLQSVIDMYPDKNLYVYIFTDDPEPEKITQQFRNSIISEKIIYDFRSEGNKHDKNVLDDFFNMMEFDILIRPRSGFSFFVQLLGRSKITIHPIKVNVKNQNTWIVTEIQIDTRQANGTYVSKKVIV